MEKSKTKSEIVWKILFRPQCFGEGPRTTNLNCHTCFYQSLCGFKMVENLYRGTRKELPKDFMIYKKQSTEAWKKWMESLYEES